MELEIPETELDDWVVVAPSGDIDVATAPVLRDALGDLVDAGTTQIILDLEHVDFIDSTGLGVLVGAVRRTRSAEGDLRIRCTNSRLLKVFEVTGLHEVFSIGDSIDDLASAGKS